MNKIVIDYVYKNYFSARSKAREDVNRIAENCGFTPFLINTRTTTEQSASLHSPIGKLLYNVRKLLILFQSVISIKRGTIVLFQYPFAPFGEFFTLFFCRCLRLKKCHLTIMAHDLVHYRETQVFNKKEIQILNTASEIIVHTPRMQKLFEEFGVNRPCKILWLFDYLTNEVPDAQHEDFGNIAYAGAFEKSLFLQKMQSYSFSNIRLHLYGNQPSNTSNFPIWMEYIGRFSPENITMLKECWGLSWDGTSEKSLDGVIGNYLKYISPHKVSLYIAACIPVILSKDSALAEYIEKNKLGITISSLLELDTIIQNQDKEELQRIKKNVMEKSEVLRKGGMLGAILKDIVQDIE